MTYETSRPSTLDVERTAVKRLLVDAYRHYDNAISRERGDYTAGYFNGYIRALQHILEMENE
jgi:hypothetical protein